VKTFSDRELIVFDMDGTLTPSKSVADREMIRLILALLEQKRIAIIGGGKYSLFREQLVDRLPRHDPRLANLFLFPTTSTAFYRYHDGWKNIYNKELPLADRTRIKAAFKAVFREMDYHHPTKTYGPVIEDRGTQISFSALGQDIVARLGKKGIRMKAEWKKKNTPLKLEMAKRLAKKLPKFEVHAAGFTTIDVTRKGIDKAYGVRQIEKYIHIPIRNMVFIGDALFPGGNDYAAKRTGVHCIAVRGPEDTKKIIKKILLSV
jgi:HAD superfamily hydrolase (TIGR01484 family)